MRDSHSAIHDGQHKTKRPCSARKAYLWNVAFLYPCGLELTLRERECY